MRQISGLHRLQNRISRQHCSAFHGKCLQQLIVSIFSLHYSSGGYISHNARRDCHLYAKFIETVPQHAAMSHGAQNLMNHTAMQTTLSFPTDILGITHFRDVMLARIHARIH